VGRKLSFIIKFDSAIGTTDLVGELIAEAIRVIHKYEDLEEGQLLNYVRRSIHNAAINIIGVKTTKSRQRIIKIVDGDNVNTLTEFKSTVYSMDCKKNYSGDNESSDSNDSADMHNLHNCIFNNKESLPLDEIVLDDIISKNKKDLSENEIKFVNLILGEYDEDFESWVSNQGYENSTVSKFIRNVYSYTGVNKKSMEKKLAELNSR
jgi:succinate dehydrogenase flavin-adding protein (antitoxin of CptAB toxin-antitoxin module)